MGDDRFLSNNPKFLGLPAFLGVLVVIVKKLRETEKFATLPSSLPVDTMDWLWNSIEIFW